MDMGVTADFGVPGADAWEKRLPKVLERLTTDVGVLMFNHVLTFTVVLFHVHVKLIYSAAKKYI